MAHEPIFQPFNLDGELRVYVRNLPHWRQPGATYFVTFRQDDSIPANVLSEWLDTRKRWYRAHGLDPPHNKPRFWQHESYDHIVRDVEELTAFRRYIARNPEAAKLRPADYTYHAAPWLDAFAARPAPW